ncbi:tRNA pseudouridine(55) synthase TruB [Radiobacillus sp. PE A8.2]|uniref:tRNA pseudouridine(55) synthase TruB n=1 Tax=Radiobacillus sp. PE A8.2 TaxID=3380349 RepID=UPI0038909A18
MDGILPLWKPKGLTSHDCVFKIRKIFQTKKVGHTGTLDPEVEGVLPICIGQATKIVPFLTETRKTYSAEITLGTATETEDRYGKIIEEANVLDEFSSVDIKQVLSSFHGEIKQIPPMYSAVKINGKKLYEYAREGKVIERPQRTVAIHHIQLCEGSINKSSNRLSFKFDVECSKGTYIRTLCVDIGKELGYPAHMSGLVRTKTGCFDKDNTYTFEEINQATDLASLLEPIVKGVEDLSVYYVDEHIKKKVLNGQKLNLPDLLPATDPFRVQYHDELLAIYKSHPDDKQLMKPVRVFN